MADTFSKEQRSWIMSRVKGKNTRPEMIVRSMAHRLGFRFRLHQKDLPGKPDLVFKRLKKIIFVHGCFWHQHKNCKHSHRPSSNKPYWNKKLDGNVERDARNKKELRKLGWKILTVWECEIKRPEKTLGKLVKFL